MQLRMRLEPCDQRLESIRVRRVIDQHHLAGLSQYRFEAVDQHVADVMVDDHDRDRREPRDRRESDGWNGRWRLCPLAPKHGRIAVGIDRCFACVNRRSHQHFGSPNMTCHQSSQNGRNRAAGSR